MWLFGIRSLTFILSFTTVSTTICNMANCRPRSSSLDQDVNLTERVVVITAKEAGTQQDCKIKMVLEDSRVGYSLSVNITIPDGIPSLSCAYYSNTRDKENTGVYGNQSIETEYDEERDIALQFTTTSTTLAKVWTLQYTDSLNWNRELLVGENDNIKKLLNRGDQDKSRNISTHCTDFTTHICPCKEPLITLDLLDNDTTLECSAVSLYEVNISWMKNGTGLEVDDMDVDNIKTTSQLLNITRDISPTNYTCTATNTNSYTTVSRSITLPAADEGKEEATPVITDDKLLTYSIIIAVVSVLVLAGLCAGVIKLLTRCANKRKETVPDRRYNQPDTTNPPEPDPTSTTDLTPGTAEPPVIYAEVKPRSTRRRQEAEDEDGIYNRLDPRLMTARRDDFRTLQQLPRALQQLTPTLPPQPGLYEETALIPMQKVANTETNNEMNNLMVDQMY